MAKDDPPLKPPRASSLGKAVNDLQIQDPKLAAEKALAAFLRPRKLVPNPYQRFYLNSADKSLALIDGVAIRTYTWPKSTRTDAPSVLLSHGYGLNAASMLSFVPPLLKLGFRVVAWDHTAHGESEGEWGSLTVIAHTLCTLAAQNAPLAGIIGSSLGATAAVMVLAQDPDIICPRLVCLGAPTQMDTVFGSFLKLHGCSLDLIPHLDQIITEKRIDMPTDVRSILKTNKIGIGTRLLVVHDRGDTVVHVKDAEFLASAVANSRVEFTQGLRHYGGLSDERVVRLVVDFVADGVGGFSKM